jgi:hypothetical protein
MPVLFIRGGEEPARALETPVDIEELKRTIHSIAV